METYLFIERLAVGERLVDQETSDGDFAVGEILVDRDRLVDGERDLLMERETC